MALTRSNLHIDIYKQVTCWLEIMHGLGDGKWDTLEQVLPRAEQLALISNEKVLTGDLTEAVCRGN